MLKNLKNEGLKARMTHEEKAAMRAAIFGAPSPVRPAQSPYVFLSVFSYRTRMVLAGMMLFVLAGGGTASAAQAALPGDLLYPIKVSINEPIEVALASDVSAKAEVAVKLAERRVEEAQALAAKGTLEVSVAEELAANFDAHAAVAEELSAQVEEEDPGTAERVKAKLATSFSANAAVLKKLGRDSKNKNTETQSEAFGARVIARAEGPSASARSLMAFKAELAPAADPAQGSAGSEQPTTMSMSADVVAPPVDAKSQKRMGALQEKAAEALEEVRVEMKQWKGDAETVAQVQNELSIADTHMAAGASLAGTQNYEAARVEFIKALKLAVRLEALLKAERRFDGGILKELINEMGEIRGVQVEILVPGEDRAPEDSR